MILFVVITRATPETSVRLWRVIQNVCCAFLITMWLQPIVLTIQIEAHKGFAIGVPLGKPLVIRNWIASLHAVCLTLCALATATLAMTDIKNKIAHAVRHMAMTIIVITRAMPETSVRLWRVIQLVWIASLTLAHAVRHMAMTITKIFNSISFRDYSLLFIKKIH